MGLIAVGGAIRAISILGLPLLEFVGLVVTSLAVVYFVPVYLKTILDLWIKFSFSMGTNLTEMGKWAVVTGASDGIGKAFAEQLANLGLNIVLISRSKDKLDLVASNIEKMFRVQTKVISVDFTHGVSVYDQIKEETEGMDIGVLINNVGIALEIPDRFLECDLNSSGNEKFLKDILFCNVFPVTLMTRLLLPGMVSRNKGVIVNIGSVLGLAPTPCLAMYSATKAYTDSLTQSLTAEYENHGVVIQSLLPGPVQTKMIKLEKPSIFSPSPETFVRSALKTIGIEKRTGSHWTHRMTVWAHSKHILSCLKQFTGFSHIQNYTDRKHGVEFLRFLFPSITIMFYRTLFEEIKIISGSGNGNESNKI